MFLRNESCNANVADQFGVASKKLIAWIGVNDRPLFARAFVSEDLVNNHERQGRRMRENVVGDEQSLVDEGE